MAASPCPHKADPPQTTTLTHAPTRSAAFPLPAAALAGLMAPAFPRDLIQGTEGTETFSCDAQHSHLTASGCPRGTPAPRAYLLPSSLFPGDAFSSPAVIREGSHFGELSTALPQSTQGFLKCEKACQSARYAEHNYARPAAGPGQNDAHQTSEESKTPGVARSKEMAWPVPPGPPTKECGSCSS